MCGIAGFIDREATAAVAGDRARAMGTALAHRGPDSSGLWQDDAAGLHLVFRRLAIQDLSEDGNQPMASRSGRYVIVFNGEIYNFKVLRAELEAAGATFRGHSDTEVMLAAIERWGFDAALRRFAGMFAFALWDREDRVLRLARDRLGKKPLYVGWVGRSLVFASELKALRAFGMANPVSREALGLYFRYGYVPAPWSIHDRIWQLLPGSALTLDLGRLHPGGNLAAEIEPYWRLPDVIERARATPCRDSGVDLVDRADALLRDCVADRLAADVPLGAFLSGGIDSSLVVALMQQLGGGTKTYSIGFDAAGHDESEHAREVAARLGTQHHEMRVDAKAALDIVPLLADIHDEPFADASSIPTFLVSQFARRSVTVALTGDGGDEMFGGYLRHTTTPALWDMVGGLPHGLRGVMARGILAGRQEFWDRLRPGQPQFGRRLHKFAGVLGAADARDAYAAQVEQWRMPPVRGLRGPFADPAGTLDGLGDLGMTEQAMVLDTLSYLPNDILVKADRAGMAASIEIRAPLLDTRLLEFAWSLPLYARVRGQGRRRTGKWLLRQVLGRYVPPALFERPKQGFTVPLEQWLAGPLRGWADDLLSLPSLGRSGMLDEAAIHDSWRRFQAGERREAGRLWTALMFQSWQRRWYL